MSLRAQWQEEGGRQLPESGLPNRQTRRASDWILGPLHP